MSVVRSADTRGMSREDWLEARRKGIGGSDAAALVGMSEYATPWTVWADKQGLAPDRPETEAMRIGRDLEEYVAKRFAEASGYKVQRANAILTNPRYPFALANIDRRIVGRKGCGLECKTTSAWNVKQYKAGNFPDRFYCQCVHYMAVTEAERWYLAVLVLGEGLHIYQMTRIHGDSTPSWCEGNVYVDSQEIESLMLAEAEFWRKYVATKTPPPVDGAVPTMAAVETVAGNGERDETVPVNCEISIRNYVELEAQIKALEQEQLKHRQAILLALGGAQRGRCSGWEIKNIPSARRTFDSKAFLADHPGDYSQYYKTSKTMRFTVKEAKHK